MSVFVETVFGYLALSCQSVHNGIFKNVFFPEGGRTSGKMDSRPHRNPTVEVSLNTCLFISAVLPIFFIALTLKATITV